MSAATEEVPVRREDQAAINEFGRLNGRRAECKQELDALQVRQAAWLCVQRTATC